MSEFTSHTHECPRCGTKWECGEANYQDECPYPLETLCMKCWANTSREKRGSGEIKLERPEDREVSDGVHHR